MNGNDGPTTTTKPRIRWASPCAGGAPSPDREEAELFGPPSFCAECYGYHARDAGDGWTAASRPGPEPDPRGNGDPADDPGPPF